MVNSLTVRVLLRVAIPFTVRPLFKVVFQVIITLLPLNFNQFWLISIWFAALRLRVMFDQLLVSDCVVSVFIVVSPIIFTFQLATFIFAVIKPHGISGLGILLIKVVFPVTVNQPLTVKLLLRIVFPLTVKLLFRVAFPVTVKPPFLIVTQLLFTVTHPVTVNPPALIVTQSLTTSNQPELMVIFFCAVVVHFIVVFPLSVEKSITVRPFNVD